MDNLGVHTSKKSKKEMTVPLKASSSVVLIRQGQVIASLRAGSTQEAEGWCAAMEGQITHKRKQRKAEEARETARREKALKERRERELKERHRRERAEEDGGGAQEKD